MNITNTASTFLQTVLIKTQDVALGVTTCLIYSFANFQMKNWRRKRWERKWRKAKLYFLASDDCSTGNENIFDADRVGVFSFCCHDEAYHLPGENEARKWGWLLPQGRRAANWPWWHSPHQHPSLDVHLANIPTHSTHDGRQEVKGREEKRKKRKKWGEGKIIMKC